jgi:hypothetical protein
MLLLLLLLLLLASRASALLAIEWALFSTSPPPLAHRQVPSIGSFLSSSNMVDAMLAAATIHGLVSPCAYSLIPLGLLLSRPGGVAHNITHKNFFWGWNV